MNWNRTNDIDECQLQCHRRIEKQQEALCTSAWHSNHSIIHKAHLIYPISHPSPKHIKSANLLYEALLSSQFFTHALILPPASTRMSGLGEQTFFPPLPSLGFRGPLGLRPHRKPAVTAQRLSSGLPLNLLSGCYILWWILLQVNLTDT